MNNNSLKMGERLFAYWVLKGIATYEVVEVRESADNIQYALQCLSCTHGEIKCSVLIAETPINGQYKLVDTLTDDEHNIYYLHDVIYYKSKSKCKKAKVKKTIEWYKDEIEKLKKTISNHEKAIKEVKAWAE